MKTRTYTEYRLVVENEDGTRQVVPFQTHRDELKAKYARLYNVNHDPERKYYIQRRTVTATPWEYTEIE